MSDVIAGALAETLGSAVRLELRTSQGHSGARAYRGVLPSGETLFVKHATTEFTRRAANPRGAGLPTPCRHPDGRLRGLPSPTRGAGPRRRGEAYWPPPWRPGDVGEIVATLDELHRQSAPPEVPVADLKAQLCGGWRLVAKEPASFLSLGLCDEVALREMLPSLMKIDEANDLRGRSICHLDLRSDNMCRTVDGWRFVDWSYASAASPALDFVLWLPSLIAELNHIPSALAEYAEHPFMVSFAGYLAARAGLPEPQGTAGNVRKIQRRQLEAAFPLARAIAGIDE